MGAWSTHERERTLRKIREVCLGLPETSERLSHGAPTFFVRGKRAFVMVPTDHHGDGRFAIWCAAPPGMQSLLGRRRPGAVLRAAVRRPSRVARLPARPGVRRRRARRHPRGRLRPGRPRKHGVKEGLRTFRLSRGLRGRSPDDEGAAALAPRQECSCSQRQGGRVVFGRTESGIPSSRAASAGGIPGRHWASCTGTLISPTVFLTAATATELRGGHLRPGPRPRTTGTGVLGHLARGPCRSARPHGSRLRRAGDRNHAGTLAGGWLACESPRQPVLHVGRLRREVGHDRPRGRCSTTLTCGTSPRRTAERQQEAGCGSR